MLEDLVSFGRVLRQPILALICTLTSIISVLMTLRFCWGVFPDERHLCMAIGTVWELAKLRFMALGCSDLSGNGWTRLRGACLLLLSLVLSAGSIGASTGYLVQSQEKTHQAALSTSRAYNDAVAALKGLDRQLQLLSDAAAQDLADKFRTRALATSAAITQKQEARAKLVAAVAAAEQGAVQGVTGPLAASAVPIHVGIALLVEIISLVSIALFEALTREDSSAQSPAPPPGSGTKDRSKRLSDARTRHHALRPAVSPASMVCRASRKKPPRSHTRRLRYTTGKSVDAMLAALDCSPHLRSACLALLQRMGEHCLHVAGTNGVLTGSEIISELNDGLTPKTMRRYLGILSDAGILLRPDSRTYAIAHFLEANRSTYQREKFSQELREKERERSQRRRAGKNLPLSSASSVELSGPSAIRPDKPQTTTHPPLAAHAATHQPTLHREEVAPWAKYLATEPGDVDVPIEAYGDLEALSEEPTVEAQPCPSIPARTRKECIRADVMGMSSLVNEHSVNQALRAIGLTAGETTTGMLFMQLSQMGIRQRLLDYAVWCYGTRSKKVRIANPMSYLMAIVRRQLMAAAEPAHVA